MESNKIKSVIASLKEIPQIDCLRSSVDFLNGYFSLDLLIKQKEENDTITLKELGELLKLMQSYDDVPKSRQ